jgi:multicomponent Na+:H+ antiporter subunit G
MRAIATDLLLAAVVLVAWLAAAGFLRLRGALDRLHCVSFLAATGGIAVAAAAFVADGLSARALKTLLLAVLLLATGAALTHASGRALVLRQEGRNRE